MLLCQIFQLIVISSHVPNYSFFCQSISQFIKVSGAKSNSLNGDVGYPQGCSFSRLIYYYTDFIRSNNSGIKMFKYANDIWH